MNFRIMGAVSACLFTFAFQSTDASLVSKLGGQVVYDSDLDITWVADANLALTNQFGLTLSTFEITVTSNAVGSTGKMIFSNANAWIAGMNAANYLGFNDWRLPYTLQPDSSCSIQYVGGDSKGFGCAGSEMGHLFYSELEALANTSALMTGNPAELAKFMNIQPSRYWSATEVGTDGSWAFDFYNGNQDIYATLSSVSYFALAVRSGDVSTVPVPTAFLLFGSGLIGLAGMVRCKKAA